MESSLLVGFLYTERYRPHQMARGVEKGSCCDSSFSMVNCIIVNDAQQYQRGIQAKSSWNDHEDIICLAHSS